jgi:hypothetical protein
MSSVILSMAAFEVIIYGRFWVTAKGQRTDRSTISGMNPDWFWTLVFVLFIAGTYIAEAFSRQHKRMKEIEKRLGLLERKG